MKLVADESVEGPTVERLRRDGHDVVYVAELEPGIDDSEVLSLARREQALLLTADKDFGELVFRHREQHFGVLLLRWMDGDLGGNAEMTASIFRKHGEEMRGCFSTLTRHGLRIRHTIV